MTILVTGGAGFIGSNFIHHWLQNYDETVINLDKLTYAGNLQNLADFDKDNRHIFIKGDIADNTLVHQLLAKYTPRYVVNFAAESHVDRSIDAPDAFIKTNVMGTFALLDATLRYWQELHGDKQNNFRFLHVSTDEVYGSLSPDADAFTEQNRYEPNSPYSASKASSDHLVRAYYHTYGLPVLTTNCSNNYGAYQFPEKLIPLMIHNALNHKPLPIYGDGLQIRDWLYVNDHCRAIDKVLANGRVGQVYNVGGLNEMANIDIVHIICDALDTLRPIAPDSSINSYRDLITHVTDRLGHDRRYAVDAQKIQNELGWQPLESFTTGITKTIHWYLDNQDWVDNVVSGDYQKWVEKQYS